MLTNSIKALVLGLLCLAILGCANTPPAPTPISCPIPVLGYMPAVDSDDLESLSDPVYWALMTREKRLTDWALELHGIAVEVCDE